MRTSIVDADLGDPTHSEGLLEVLDSYAREAVGGGRPLSADVRSRLVPALNRHPNALVLLAIHSKRPVGAAVCFVGLSTFAARPVLNIHDLAVLPEFRDAGIGRSLLEAASARARELHCCKLTLEVRQDNERALSLYRRFGFGDFAAGAQPATTLFLEKRL